MKEVWKDIYFKENGIVWDYRGLYQVSNLGRIKSLARADKRGNKRKEKILKPYTNRYGYVMVVLTKNSKRKTFSVHQLVAIMFIKNPLNKPQVNHKFGIKTDNRASQLEWATTSENIVHAYSNGLTKHYTKKVLQYDLEGNFICEWECIKEASISTNINRTSIINCCKQKRKTAGGFIWKYKD